MTRRVLVLGKNGQLGQSLQKVAAQYPLFELDFAGRDRLDLESAESISTFFDRLEQPYAGIINAAAYTAVDRAESEQELARQVNQHAVAQLAGIARQQGSYFLHVSTDYVFSGQACRPYTEADTTAPVNAYGASKLGGEQALLASGCRGALCALGGCIRSLATILSKPCCVWAVNAESWGSYVIRSVHLLMLLIWLRLCWSC